MYVNGDWLLCFDTKKCKVFSYGNIHFEMEYSFTNDDNNSHKLSSGDF